MSEPTVTVNTHTSLTVIAMKKDPYFIGHSVTIKSPSINHSDSISHCHESIRITSVMMIIIIHSSFILLHRIEVLPKVYSSRLVPVLPFPLQLPVCQHGYQLW